MNTPSHRPPITSHILNLVTGKPAAGIRVRVYKGDRLLAEGKTNPDGRVQIWTPELKKLAAGTYVLEFQTAKLFKTLPLQGCFYPRIRIEFGVTKESLLKKEHFHIPLLISPYGYTTYRGS